MSYGGSRGNRGGAKQQAPPTPSGTVVREFERPGFRGDPDTKLVVAADAHHGHPFLYARTWEQGRDGAFYPTKKGVTIKVTEAREFAESILQALELCGEPTVSRGASRPNPRPSTPAPPRAGPLSRHVPGDDRDRHVPPWEATRPPVPSSDFDEFSSPE